MKCVACDTRLTGRATRFCSNRCKVATWKRERPDAAQQQRERASRALADKARQRDLPLRQCLLCGETFGSARGAMLCSDECRKVWLGGIADVEPARRKARSAVARLG